MICRLKSSTPTFAQPNTCSPSTTLTHPSLKRNLRPRTLRKDDMGVDMTKKRRIRKNGMAKTAEGYSIKFHCLRPVDLRLIPTRQSFLFIYIISIYSLFNIYTLTKSVRSQHW